jgi:hypothetical protein
MPTGLGDEKLWLCPTLDNVTPFNDLSDQANNGTAVGGLSTVSDTSNGGAFAYDFDGVGDYISVLGGVGTGTTDAFCLSYWMNWAGNQTDYIWDMDYPENNALSVFGGAGPTRIQAITRPNSDGTGNTFNNVSANTWVHVLFQREAGSNLIKAYFDGGLKPTTRIASDPITLGNDTTIGNNIDGASLYAYEGKMDDIRWFNKSLTKAEIAHLSSQRGIEGPAPVGLGDEQMWFCPSLRADGNDITASATNEVLVGSMAIVSDTQSGGSLAYDTPDGATGGLTFTAPASTIASGQAANITVAMWADHTSYVTSSLFTIGANSFSDYLSISGISNDFVRGFVHGGIISGNEQFTRGNPMQHYVFEFTSTSIKTWVNGTFASTVTGTWAGDTWDRGAIGALARAVLTEGTQCTLDDIRVYGRPITQSEITHLATSRGIEGSPSTCGLITDMTYWSDFDDAASSMADENGGSDTLDATLSPAVISSGSPRSSDCTNIVNAYYSLNSGANQPAPPSDYSFSIWARCTGTGSTGAWIAGQRQSTAMAGWNVFRRSSNGLVVFMELAGGVAARVVEVASMSLNTWYLLSFSRNNAGLYAYVNGSLVGSDTTATTQGTEAAPMRIGVAPWDPTFAAAKYNGQLWSCGMWDRELTAAEHLQLYAGGQGLLYSELCPTPPTTGFYNPFINKIFNNDYTRRIR